jgi:hypothetical protein
MGTSKGLSILSNRKECYLCHSTLGLEKHHIFPGPLRKVSEENGFWVYLCLECHTGSKSVHFTASGVDNLKKMQKDCERKYLETHSLEEWMKLMRRNYLV